MEKSHEKNGNNRTDKLIVINSWIQEYTSRVVAFSQDKGELHFDEWKEIVFSLNLIRIIDGNEMPSFRLQRFFLPSLNPFVEVMHMIMSKYKVQEMFRMFNTIKGRSFAAKRTNAQIN